ncbi:MAG: hypothetical protein WB559_15165, partial [Candidatus Acidiferrales bacterium]
LHTRPIVSAASSFHRPILTIFSFPSSAPPRSHHDRTGNRHHRNHQHQQKTIGYLVQLGGIAAFTLGVVFSLHHVAIGAAYLGGAAAFYVGQKIRAMS